MKNSKIVYITIYFPCPADKENEIEQGYIDGEPINLDLDNFEIEHVELFEPFGSPSHNELKFTETLKKHGFYYFSAFHAYHMGRIIHIAIL